jgi:hypothetical protein
MKTENLKRMIKQNLEIYKMKTIKIKDKEYTLYVVPELCDEDLNVFEGFLFIDTKKKSEVNYLINRYKTPVSGYFPRMVLILYNDNLFIKDYLRNKYIAKTLNEIDKMFIDKLKNALTKPTEDNLLELITQK